MAVAKSHLLLRVRPPAIWESGRVAKKMPERRDAYGQIEIAMRYGHAVPLTMSVDEHDSVLQLGFQAESIGIGRCEVLDQHACGGGR